MPGGKPNRTPHFHQAGPAAALIEQGSKRRLGLGVKVMGAVDDAMRELAQRGLCMSTVFGARRNERFPDGLPWTCTLRYERRRMTTTYYTQARFEREPSVAEVLASLFEDAWRFEHAHDLIEFSGAFGHERDGRRAEWVYAACGDAAAGLRHLLDGDYRGVALALVGTRPIADRAHGQQLTAFPLTANAPTSS